MSLRDAIGEILVRHDPLGVGDDPACDLTDAYSVEADELADLLAGTPLGAGDCASVIWAVIASAVGPVEAGPLGRYGMIGADIAAVIGDHPADEVPVADDDDDTGDDDELPNDPVVIAVLAILDDRDPAGVADDPEKPVHDDEMRYAAASEDIAGGLFDITATAEVCAQLARDVLEPQFGTLASDRLRDVGADLAELADLAEYVRIELAIVEADPGPRPAEEPADPFCAGLLALLARHDPAVHGEAAGAYLTEAEEIAELLRDSEPDSNHDAAVCWAVVRRWCAGAAGHDIDTYLPLGRDVAYLLELYRELAASHPELVEPTPADGAARLAGEPLALRVHDLLLRHDPFGLVETGEPDTADYVPYARELAVRLADGSPNAGWCQVLAWKVLTEPWGGLGGSLGRFRDLGHDLHTLAAV
jgi:hypothetical protein